MESNASKILSRRDDYMLVSKTMNTSVDNLHQFLSKMVLQDIKETSLNASHQEIDESLVNEGFTYTKKILNKTGKSGVVKVIIEALKPGLYEVSFESSNGVNTIKYSYEENDADTINLIYEEDFVSEAKTKSLNHSLMSRLYQRSNKKRINAQLDRIQSLINEQPV